jgi:hypothetical protein
MSPLHVRRSSTDRVVSTVAVGGTINPDRTPTRGVSPSDTPRDRLGQLSAFDRLIWGRGQEPVIEG